VNAAAASGVQSLAGALDDQLADDYLDNAVGASDVLGCSVLPGADGEHCGHWRASFGQTLGRETRVEEGVN
jgi:hypothetical protein